MKVSTFHFSRWLTMASSDSSHSTDVDSSEVALLHGHTGSNGAAARCWHLLTWVCLMATFITEAYNQQAPLSAFASRLFGCKVLPDRQ